MTRIAATPAEVTATWFAVENTPPALLHAFDRQSPGAVDEIFAFALTTLGLIHLRLVRGQGSLFHSPEHVTRGAIESLISYLEAPRSPISDIQLRAYDPDAGTATSFGDERIGKRDAIVYFRGMLEARETRRARGANAGFRAERPVGPPPPVDPVRFQDGKIVDLTKRQALSSSIASRALPH